MFKYKTYSEILDQMAIDEEYIKKQEEEQRLKKEVEKNREIEDAIIKASQEASKIVGTRLMMLKKHETYYEWIFRSLNNSYRCHIYANKNEGIDSYWELTEENGYSIYCHKKIQLIYLSLALIEWVTKNLEWEGINIKEIYNG